MLYCFSQNNAYKPLQYKLLQYRHLIPAPVDRTSASSLLYKHPRITCQQNMPSTSVTEVACESQLRSVVESSMYQRPGNYVATRLAVVYHAQAAHAFIAGIEYQHCTCR